MDIVQNAMPYSAPFQDNVNQMYPRNKGNTLSESETIIGNQLNKHHFQYQRSTRTLSEKSQNIRKLPFNSYRAP